MGAWGYGSFENDTVLDWLNDFVEAEDQVGFIAQAFQALDKQTDYLDADFCWDALAACEVIAALKGAPAPELPENVRDWVQAHQFEEVQHLRASALRAIGQITTESELKDLWGDGDEYSDWLAVQTDLQARLQP